MIGSSSSSGISTGALVGIILGTIAVAVTLSAIGFLLILKNRLKKYHTISRRRKCEYLVFFFFFYRVRGLHICEDIENSDIHYNLLGARTQI